MNNPVRVRFAPSPTGHLHIGGIRTAMFNWLFARSTGGTYLLRIEDTDVQRSTKEYEASQLHSLTWTQLLPDEPLVYQMARVNEHQAAAKHLLDQGKVYPCFCEPRDADLVIEELEQGVGRKYDGACRNKPFTSDDLKRPHALRFRIPGDITQVSFDDAIRGKITVQADQLDDFIIIRRDGTPIYNFCVVVDDIYMKITHVIRGEDHITNTIKQLLFYRALGAQEPQFAHLPLILGPSGNKLSKRDASVSVEEYRVNGFMADALINYLVRLGWSHGDQEVFTRDEMVQHFKLDDVGKKGAIFDMKKLLWLNGVYIRQSTPQQLMHALEQMNQTTADMLCALWSDKEERSALLELYKQRASTLVELGNDIAAFAHDPQELDVKLLDKWRTIHTKPMLESFLAQLVQYEQLAHDRLLEGAQALCQSFGEKLVNLAQPLRLALTGSIQSPGVFELISILGKNRSCERIKKLITVLAVREHGV